MWRGGLGWAYLLPTISSSNVALVPAAHVATTPEIRFVNSVVQIHLVTSTFRADWLLFQAVLSFLIRDFTSCRATRPIHGLRDDG